MRAELKQALFAWSNRRVEKKIEEMITKHRVKEKHDKTFKVIRKNCGF